MTVIEEARTLLQGRLKELDAERTAIEKSINALQNGTPTPARRGRPRKAKAANGRRRGGRRDQAVALIGQRPGITASDIARRMRIKPNYLYRVLGDLEKDGQVSKKGRQYFPKG